MRHRILSGAGCASLFFFASVARSQTTGTDFVLPQNSSGSSQTFTFQFSDSNGYQDLLNGSYHILINSGPDGTNSCWVQIGPDGVRLAPDDPNGGWVLVVYNSNMFAGNSQCAVSGGGTTISGSGNTLLLTVAYSFRPAYAGTKTIYTDTSASHFYSSVDSYTVVPTTADFILGMTPSSRDVPAGQSTTYAVTAQALNGSHEDVTLVLSQHPAGVSGTFNPPVLTGGSGSSSLTITADASAPSSSGTIVVTGTSASTSHTTAAQLNVTASGMPATVSTNFVTPQNASGSSQTFSFQFSDSNGYHDLFNGSYHILINTNPDGTNSCWAQIGPDGLRLAPDNPNGAWVLVPYGTNTIAQNSQCVINGAGTTISSYDPTILNLNVSYTFSSAYAGTKTIYTDTNSSHFYTGVDTYAVTSSGPDFTLSMTPDSQTVQPGQSANYIVKVSPLNGFHDNVALSLILAPAGVSVTFNPSVIAGGSGTSTVTATAAPSAPYTQNGTIWIQAQAPTVSHGVINQLTVGSQPPPPTLSTDSVSPQNGSGSGQVFTFQFSDSRGYQDLFDGRYHVLFNSAVDGRSGCWVELLSTGVNLAPDDPSQAWTFVGYGSSQSAQNSQCLVAGVGTTVSGSGNNLTLSLALSFRAAFDGALNIYTDVNGSAPNYAAVGSYTVQ